MSLDQFSFFFDFFHLPSFFGSTETLQKMSRIFKEIIKWILLQPFYLQIIFPFDNLKWQLETYFYVIDQQFESCEKNQWNFYISNKHQYLTKYFKVLLGPSRFSMERWGWGEKVGHENEKKIFEFSNNLKLLLQRIHDTIL